MARTMVRGLAKTRPGRGLELIEFERPTAGPGELLVRVTASGICGTDVGHYEGRPEYAAFIELPRVLGHEFVGIVEEAGEGTRTPIGTRVTADSDSGCGTCWWCRRDMSNACENQDRLGSHRHGGLAEYVLVPERSIYAVPEGVTDHVACLLEPFGAASHAVHLLPNLVGGTAAVMGPGPVGLLAGLMLLDGGCAPVLISGLSQDAGRLRVAEQLGLTPGTVEENLARAGDLPGSGVDVVVDAVGYTESLRSAIDLVRFGGHISVVGIGKPGTFDPLSIVQKALTVHGVWRRVPHSWDRLLAVTARHPELATLVDGVYGLDEYERAFAALAERQHVKTVIEIA